MKILFVCTGNAYRSPLAEALLKKFRPDLTVDSAGLHVAIPIAAQIRDYLASRNAIGFLKNFPEGIEEKELRAFDLIVAMESRHKLAVLKECPDCVKKIVVWNIEDPYFEEEKGMKKIFNTIEDKVNELAKSLQPFWH
jgi:protein-tyrosine phosphatase